MLEVQNSDRPAKSTKIAEKANCTRGKKLPSVEDGIACSFRSHIFVLSFSTREVSTGLTQLKDNSILQ